METAIPYLAGAALVLGLIFRLVRYEEVGAATVSIGLIALVALAIPSFKEISLNLKEGEISLAQCEDALAAAPTAQARATVIGALERSPDLKLQLRQDLQDLRVPHREGDLRDRLRTDPARQ